MQLNLLRNQYHNAATGLAKETRLPLVRRIAQKNYAGIVSAILARKKHVLTIVDLSDVARQMAIHADKEVLYIEDDGRGDHYDDASDWVLITSNQTFLSDIYIRSFEDKWPHDLKPIIWTDDFNNLFDVVDW